MQEDGELKLREFSLLMFATVLEGAGSDYGWKGGGQGWSRKFEESEENVKGSEGSLEEPVGMGDVPVFIWRPCYCPSGLTQ